MQTHNVPFHIGETYHSVRVVIGGLVTTHSVFLDDALCYSHRVKTANGCAVYVLYADDDKIEVLVRKLPHETIVKVYVNDISISKADELTLSQQLDILSTASQISFGTHFRHVWKRAIWKWLIWAVCCVLLLGAVQGYTDWKMWLLAAGIALIPVPIGLLLDVGSSYREVRRFCTPEDCYQHPDTVSSMVD